MLFTKTFPFEYSPLEIFFVVEEASSFSSTLLGVLIAVAMEVVGEHGRATEENTHRSAGIKKMHNIIIDTV